ncbi:JAB domain-containing protein [Vibrio mediterranei]
MTLPNLIKAFCQTSLSAKENEVFGVTFLDNQHRFRSSAEMFIGTIHSASVFPRKIIKRSLPQNAAAVLLHL